MVILGFVQPSTTAQILDGTGLARRLREQARSRVFGSAGPPPHLRVLLVGEDPASQAYVSAKAKAAAEAGIEAETRRLPADVSPEALLTEVARANADPGVNGILVQLPLPPGPTTRRAFSTRCIR